VLRRAPSTSSASINPRASAQVPHSARPSRRTALVQPGDQQRQERAQHRRPFGVLGAAGGMAEIAVELEIARFNPGRGQGLIVRKRFPFPTASATESGETTQPLALRPRYPAAGFRMLMALDDCVKMRPRVDFRDNKPLSAIRWRVRPCDASASSHSRIFKC